MFSYYFIFQVQISAYLDNVFDVAALMEDSETKTAALEKVAELEDELGHVSDINLYTITSSVQNNLILSINCYNNVRCRHMTVWQS